MRRKRERRERGEREKSERREMRERERYRVRNTFYQTNSMTFHDFAHDFETILWT